MMNLHLLVPALFWPDLALPEIYRDLPLPALENLLAKCSSTEDEPQEMEVWLCRAFGVRKQQDWPVAPITLQTDGADAIKAGNDYWIRADPVHLRIEREHIVLADSRVFSISPQESHQLADLLNRHLGENDQKAALLPLRADRWYLRLDGIPPAKTHLLSEVANRGINELLPFGTNNSFWRGLFNEIQMLLHEHPLNQLREARGELAINSVWFWGGGIMPESFASRYTSVSSNHVLADSLASACGVKRAQLPADATAWHESATAGNHLITLDTLYGKAQYGDAYGWRQSIQYLERNWFDPLWRMFRQGQFDQITLTTLGEGGSKDFVATRADSKKFWRRSKPISTYAG